MLASVEVQTVLLVLKICFLVLLYLFIWRIVRSASRDVRMPQESFIMGPTGGRARTRAPGAAGELRHARHHPQQRARARAPLRAEREGDHCRPCARRTTSGWTTTSSRPEARAHRAARDGVWVEDTGSTNGTYVNGTRLARAQSSPRRRRPHRRDGPEVYALAKWPSQVAA